MICETDYKIKPYDWKNIRIYFLKGVLYLCLCGFFFKNFNSFYTIGYLLEFNIVFFVLGVISLYYFIKKPITPIQKYISTLFFIGLIYSIFGIFCLVSRNFNLIQEVGIGIPLCLLAGIGGLGLYYIPLTIQLFFELKFSEKNPSWEDKNEHTGVIIVHYKNPLKNTGFIGIKTLISGFSESRWEHYILLNDKYGGLKNNEPYRLYHCYTIPDIINVIESPKVKRLWLFGHGVEHGIDTDEGTCYYCEILNKNQKDWIAQMHCNCHGGKSLCEYLLPPDKVQTNCLNNKALRNAAFDIPEEIKKYLKKINQKSTTR